MNVKSFNGLITFFFRLQLEKHCGNECVFRVDHQISKDGIQSFKYAEVEKEDREDKVQQWRDLNYKLILEDKEDNFSYIVSHSCLESGYLYSFKLELKDGKVLKYSKLSAIG